MNKVIQIWKEFRYKKTFLFGCFVVFVYFYDFTYDTHGMGIKNISDKNITLVEILNDDNKILPRKKIIIKPQEGINVGNSYTLKVSAYGGSTLKVTFMGEDQKVITADCNLTRPKGFRMRLFDGERYVYIDFNGSKKLICVSKYVGSGFGLNGLNKQLFEFQNE